MDEETHKKIHELQELEHSIQSLLMQKQNLQIELSEISVLSLGVILKNIL